MEKIPRLVAEDLVSAQGPVDESNFATVIERTLLRRGRAAHDLIAGLQDTLARTLEKLSSVAPLAHADPSSIRGFHVGGLPAINLDGVREETSLRRPWWAGLAPPIAVRVTERGIGERNGKAMKEAVEFYDRQLESLVKAKLARLIDLYEMQAGAFREQISALPLNRPTPSRPSVKVIRRRT